MTSEEIKARQSITRPMSETPYLGRNRELWLCEYKKDAYTDQAGLTQWGYVVYEMILVEEIEAYDVYEEYGNKWYENVGRIAKEVDGERIFNGYPNLVDYHGGTSWRERDKDGPPWWKEAPYYYVAKEGGLGDKGYGYARGYVYPDGTGPVKGLRQEGTRP